MKKISLIALALAGTMQMAQAESKLQKVEMVNASGVASKSEQSFYNAKNQLAFRFTFSIYNNQATLDSYIYQFYDEQGRMVSDSTQYKKNYYTYDNLGQVIKKVGYSNNNNPNSPDTPQDSTLYFYTGAVLDSLKEVTSYNTTLYTMKYNEKGLLSQKEQWGTNYYNGYAYGVVNRTKYSYDANDNLVLEEVFNIRAEYSEFLTDNNSYYYNEQNQMVCDTLKGQYSTSAHAYTYNEDGTLATKSYSSYYSYSGWSQGNTEVYTYSDYSADYALTQVTAEADASVPTTILFSFEGPANKQGFEGCQLMVDGKLLDEVYSLNDKGQLVATDQQRGLHTYRLLPVFNGQAANVSDELAYNLEFALPTPTNLHFVNKEFQGNASFGNWNITVEWEAPEASNFVLEGYKWSAAGNKGNCGSGTNNVNTTKAQFYDYGWSGDVVTVSVQAVYNVGLSDAITISYVVADHDDQITAHWHNDWATLTDEDGEMTSKQHMLYLPKFDYNDTEGLYATITFDPEGNPVYRTNDTGLETKKWNAETWTWDDYRLTEVTRTSGYETKREEKLMTEDGWIVIRREQTYYEGNKVTNRSLETLVNGVLVYRNFTRTTDAYGTKLQEDIYTDNEGNVTGKTVRNIKGYDPSNILRFTAVTEYDYVDEEYVPVSRVVYDIADDWTVKSETTQSYEEGDWTTDYAVNYAFTASKEYSSTHTPKGELTGDIDANDNPVVEWVAPARTKELTGYDIYIDDLKYASVDAETCKYEFGALKMPKTAKGYHKVRIMAMYNEAENCLSSECEIEVINVDDVVSLQHVAQQGADVMMYDITGRQLRAADLSNLTGQMVIIRTQQANGEVSSRMVLLQ